MASLASKEPDHPQGEKANSKSSSSSASDESSTEEERLKRLFQSCDRNGDGFIDSDDVLYMCTLLNMEEAGNELLEQLEVAHYGRISFDHFMRCRMRLMLDPDHEGSHRTFSPAPLKSVQDGTNDRFSRESPCKGSLSLCDLLQHHHPQVHQKLKSMAVDLSGDGSSVMDVINSLHLAAVTSVQRDLLQWKNHAHLMEAEKNALESRFKRHEFAECDEERLEQQALRYEERITELHSVIAELRKKMDQNPINMIREEDEYEDSDDGAVSQSGVSANDNNANDSVMASMADLGNDFNSELSRVVSQLEKSRLESSVAEPQSETVVKMMRMQLSQAEEEKEAVEEMYRQQEVETEGIKLQLSNMHEERDRLKRKVHELQTRLQSFEASGSTGVSPLKPSSPAPRGYESEASVVQAVSRKAELKKLKTSFKMHGAEIAASGLPIAKVAEHLSQSVQEESNVQELIQAANQEGNTLSDAKINTFEIELERLQSKIDNLKSQNDLLNLTLEESRSHCDRLTVLIGKYESNNTALQLAVGYSDHAMDAYQALVQLLETDQAVLLANCRAAGLGVMGSSEDDPEVFQQDISLLLQSAHLKRKTAEHHAKQLLIQREVRGQQCASPWEELSSSRTASTTSSTGSDTEFTKQDEARLRDVIRQLCTERQAVKMTTMALESVHLDPLGYEATPPNPEAQRMDLENAVLMQELMAMKEEKAELKAQNYLLEKERGSLELQLRGKESQEKVYQLQIDHLKGQVDEQQQTGVKKDDGYDSATPAITLAELRSHNVTEVAQDLNEALKREKKLKGRVQELVATLEKLSKNSEIRHQQSAEFVNDLKKANSALVTAFEKAKKKYMSKVKKMEMQLKISAEKYESQVLLLNQRISHLEDESTQLRRQMSETSL